MTPHLRTLSSLGSPAILGRPLVGQKPAWCERREGGGELFEWLAWKNGFYAFESALHVLPSGDGHASVMDLERWNTADVWVGTYEDLAKNAWFFAEDVFGNQFCLTSEGVGSFDAETGGVALLAETLEGWAEVMVGEYELHSGYPLARAWQGANRALEAGERLVPRRPFIIGGEYNVQNLRPVDAVEGMRRRGAFALQIRDVPDGAQVEYTFW